MKIEKCFCCESETTIYIEDMYLGRCEICGYAWQIDAKPFIYDEKYLKKAYGSAPQKEMSWLRVAMLYNFIRTKTAKILDFGCGYGNFVKLLNKLGYVRSYGYDIIEKNYQIGLDSCKKTNWDVITLFDSLEHVKDLNEVFKLKTNRFIVTVPNLYKNMDTFAIKNWKHYKPDEHLHYFTSEAIVYLFDRFGYQLIDRLNVEDLIRKPEGQITNTMTYFFTIK